MRTPSRAQHLSMLFGRCSKGERTGTMTCDSPSSAAPQRVPRRAAQHAPYIVLAKRHQRREGQLARDVMASNQHVPAAEK